MIKEIISEYLDSLDGVSVVEDGNNIPATSSRDIICEIVRAAATNANTLCMNNQRAVPKPMSKPTQDEKLGDKEAILAWLESKGHQPYTTDYIAKATKINEHTVVELCEELEHEGTVYVTYRRNKEGDERPWYGYPQPHGTDV